MTLEVTSTTVRVKHLRTAGICADGAQRWWEREGMDWRDFVRNGIAAQKLLDTADPRAVRLVEIARNDDGR